VRDDDHFVTLSKEMLRQTPDVILDASKTWVKEIANHCDAVALSFSTRRRHLIRNFTVPVSVIAGVYTSLLFAARTGQAPHPHRHLVFNFCSGFGGRHEVLPFTFARVSPGVLGGAAVKRALLVRAPHSFQVEGLKAN
jgi:hypothetical protein